MSNIVVTVSILCYMLLVILLAIKSKTKKLNSKNFFLGARQLTLPAFVATLVTTWYGGILGIGSLVYNYGIASILIYGVPYYLFAVIYAIFIAPKINKSRNSNLTIPGMMGDKFGVFVKKFSALLFFFITLPTAYTLSIGIVLNFLTGVNLITCVIIGTALSTFYVSYNGFSSVVKTDKLQFIFMYCAFIFVILFLFSTKGVAPLKHVPKELLTVSNNKIGFIISWYFIALWTFISPTFHQRSLAANSPKTARNGILISVLLWFMFDMMTLLSGLYVKVLFPHLTNPATGYLLLGSKILPSILAAVFFVGIFSIIMSTIDSYTLISSFTLMRDFFGKTKIFYYRLSVIMVAVLSVIIAISLGSVIWIWYVIGNLFIPPLLLPFLSLYIPWLKIEKIDAIVIMVSSFIATTALFTISAIYSHSLVNIHYLFNMQPMIIGIFVSIIAYSLCFIVKKLLIVNKNY